MKELSSVGIIGSGYIGRGATLALAKQPGLQVSRVLTRRDTDFCGEFPRPDLLTNSLQELIDHSEIVLECSGDVIYATDVLSKVLDAGLPVVTMDSELHVTTGSYLLKKGLLTEAEGDQPGCLAALNENAREMGFTPLVYGNLKGFLNPSPILEDMLYWAERNGISLQQVTSFTDGTKIQIEQAFVANGLGADIGQPGLHGIASDSIQQGGETLAAIAQCLGRPISDYLLCSKFPAGVFIIAEHDEAHKKHFQHLKMGDGPFYALVQTFHLCHLEIAKTIRRVLRGDGSLLTNSESPRNGVAAVAKHSFKPGDRITRGIGSFDVRGLAVRLREFPDAIPIGLLSDAVVTRFIEPGQILTYDDVELPESLAYRACLELRSLLSAD